MNIDKLQENIDRMFHHHGDILIKLFSVLVALFLLGLWFISTRQSPFVANDNSANEVQQVNR